MKLSLKAHLVLCGQTQPSWVWLCVTKSLLKANPADTSYRAFYTSEDYIIKNWGGEWMVMQREHIIRSLCCMIFQDEGAHDSGEEGVKKAAQKKYEEFRQTCGDLLDPGTYVL